MTRILVCAAAFALLSLAAIPASSQRLQQPTAAPPATSGPQNTGVGPKLNAARPAPTATIPADPSQRPRPSAQIPSTGPSVPAPPNGAAKPIRAAERAAVRQVLDDTGRIVPGAVQVSPTRAYDPATGRYFHTMQAPQPR